MKFLNDYWGLNENISPLELAARAAVMFLVAMIMLRIAGMRPFGRGNTFDVIITFLIGGILSRGVIGATPFFSCIAGAIVILLVNKLIAVLSRHSKAFERLVKGNYIVLYENGKFVQQNLKKADMSEKDVHEQLRLLTQKNSLHTIQQVYLENSGKISFVEKES